MASSRALLDCSANLLLVAFFRIGKVEATHWLIFDVHRSIRYQLFPRIPSVFQEQYEQQYHRCS